MIQPLSAMSARSLAAAPLGQSSRASAGSQPVPSPVPQPPRATRWRWLAPSGAIAAGLLVWIALHEKQPVRFPSPVGIQTAKNEASPAPPPLVSNRPAAAPPRAQPSLSASRSAADELASSKLQAQVEALKQRQKVDFAGKVAPVEPRADKESGVRKDAERDSSTSLFRSPDQVDLDAKAVTGGVQKKAGVPAEIETQAASNYEYSSATTSAGPATLPKAQNAARAKSAENAPVPSAPAHVSGAAGQFQAGASMQLVVVANPSLITAPGSHVLWRTGPAGLIEYSKSGGASWSRQASGVLVDLVTGFAPSVKVCWIVGRAGAILLTTDGGAHWKLVPSPLKEDLDGVRAADAAHAVVWNVRNSQIYETSDAGVNWKRVANQ